MAQTPLETVYLSSDIWTRIYLDDSETANVVAGDEAVFTWSSSGSNGAFGVFTSVADRVDVVGFNLSPRRYAVATSIVLDGVLIQPGDVFTVNSSLTDPVIVFDGQDNALPAGVRIDAVTIDPVTGDLVLSFDRSVGVSPLFRRADLVRWTGSTYQPYFQGSMLPDRADINGAHILKSGNILMTFASGIMVPGEGGAFYVRDDDVVEYEVATGLFRPTAVDVNSHPAWQRTAMDALGAVEGGGDALFSDRFEG